MRFVGIDPGLLGGVGILDLDERGELIGCALHRTPTLVVRRGRRTRHEYDLAGMGTLLALATHEQPVHVVIEAQGARPGQGVVSMFRLGYGIGLWVGLVAGRGIPYRTIAPAVWKRHHGLLGTNKAASRLRCAERFPALGPIAARDEGGSEGLLMALAVADTHKDEARRDAARRGGS